MAIDSAQYRVTLRSIILRGTWLGAVSYCAELDSAQYDTARSQSRKTPITRRNLDKNRKYFKPLLSDQGRLKLWKKTGRKSSLTVPLKRIRKRHLTRRSMILRRTWLSAVWYCAELDSAQYDTARNFEKIRISRRNLNQKRNYFNPLVSGPGRFEW